MTGYWKIPNEWISEWHLSAIECIVLADLMLWNCTMKERAERCGISYRSVREIVKKVLKVAAEKWQNFPPEVAKISTQSGKNFHSKWQKFPLNTFNTINNNESNNSARTHEGEDDDGLKKETEQPKVDNPITSGSNLKKVEEVAEEFFAEVGGETQTAERFERLYHLPRSKIAEAVPIFRDTLLADGIDYKSIGDFRRHFNAWLKLNANRIFKDIKTNGRQTYDNARDNDAYLASLMDDLRSAFAGGDVQ